MPKSKLLNFSASFLLILINLPLIYLALQIFRPIEQRLLPSLIYTYFIQTFLLIIFVGILSIFLGFSLAWIISAYDFPFRKFFKVAFALPLAIPPYIAAHAYADFFYYYGLFPKILNKIGLNYHLDIFNLKGAIFIYVITLYPYIYLLCLSFFRYNCGIYVNNARILGAGHFKLCFKIALPLARPSLVAGVTLVLMELISDFGVVDYFGVQVFSSAIYKLWQSYGDFYGALRLSAYLLIFILFIVLAEQYTRRRLRYYQTTTKNHDLTLINLSPIRARLLTAVLSCIFFIVFLIPLIQLCYHAVLVYSAKEFGYLLKIMGNTIFYTAIAAILCSLVALLSVRFLQAKKGISKIFFANLASMGYSIPGVILGLAVLFTLLDLDKALVPLYRFLGEPKRILILSSSIFALFFAYIVRFLAISFNQLQLAYKKLSPTYLEVASTLGFSKLKTFLLVEWPLIKASFWSAFLLVFLEVLKELPITLMLKPFRVETLTGRVFLYVHNEQIAYAALPSLLIISLGIIVVSYILLSKKSSILK